MCGLVDLTVFYSSPYRTTPIRRFLHFACFTSSIYHTFTRCGRRPPPHNHTNVGPARTSKTNQNSPNQCIAGNYALLRLQRCILRVVISFLSASNRRSNTRCAYFTWYVLGKKIRLRSGKGLTMNFHICISRI